MRGAIGECPFIVIYEHGRSAEAGERVAWACRDRTRGPEQELKMRFVIGTFLSESLDPAFRGQKCGFRLTFDTNNVLLDNAGVRS